MSGQSEKTADLNIIIMFGTLAVQSLQFVCNKLTITTAFAAQFIQNMFPWEQSGLSYYWPRDFPSLNCRL